MEADFLEECDIAGVGGGDAYIWAGSCQRRDHSGRNVRQGQNAGEVRINVGGGSVKEIDRQYFAEHRQKIGFLDQAKAQEDTVNALPVFSRDGASAVQRTAIDKAFSRDPLQQLIGEGLRCKTIWQLPGPSP